MVSPLESRTAHFPWLLLALALAGAFPILSAQEEGKAKLPANKTGAEAPQPVFFLRDGSRITGLPDFDSLQVKTRYGTLNVPSTDLVRLRLIPRTGNEPREDIEAEILRLGGSDFEEREAAMDALRKLGTPALPFLSKLTTSDDEEVRNRSYLLIGEIRSRTKESNKHGDEFPALVGTADEVITRRFKIKGSIEATSFKVRSRYGTLEIKVADILGVDFRSGGVIEETLTIGGKQMVPANWSNTKLFIAAGITLRIKASGNLFVQNYNLNSGPQGTTRYTGNTFRNFPMLSLVGKIGRNGTPFFIGANYKAQVKTGGVLQLGVVPFRTNYNATGTYRARITTGD